MLLKKVEGNFHDEEFRRLNFCKYFHEVDNRKSNDIIENTQMIGLKTRVVMKYEHL